MDFLSRLKQDVVAAVHLPSAAPTTGAPPVVSPPGILHQIPVRRTDPVDSVERMDIGGRSVLFDSPEITTATPISPNHNRACTAPTHPDRDSFLQCLATDMVSSFNGGMLLVWICRVINHWCTLLWWMMSSHTVLKISIFHKVYLIVN